MRMKKPKKPDIQVGATRRSPPSDAYRGGGASETTPRSVNRPARWWGGRQSSRRSRLESITQRRLRKPVMFERLASAWLALFFTLAFGFLLAVVLS